MSIALYGMASKIFPSPKFALLSFIYFTIKITMMGTICDGII
jgi:hypothetical protein